jgi:hypothetical protein
MVKVGSAEWWTQAADKVLDTGLSVIQTKLQGVNSTGGTTANETSMTRASSGYLPYIIGAVVIGGIVLVLAKR